MTPEQHVIFAADIRANTDAAVVSALAARNDSAIADWYNQVSTTKAWKTSVSREELFDNMNLTSYDGLSAGKRDAWRILLDFAPIDPTRDKVRAAIVDVWPTADETVMLNACAEYALKVEVLFGGTSATSGTVTAIKRNYVGATQAAEVSHVLNNY
jgi:hypothetical protein